MKNNNNNNNNIQKLRYCKKRIMIEKEASRKPQRFKTFSLSVTIRPDSAIAKTA